jgi:hypothetical protein
MSSRIGVAVFALVCACATSLPVPDSGKSGAWGYVHLVPLEGVGQKGSGSGGYGDRAMRDVELVDYSRPGFAVVYVEGPLVPDAPARFSIRSGVRTRLEPRRLAVGLGSAIEVTNSSDRTHTLSCPAAGLIRTLAPGETAEIRVAEPGEVRLFLLDVPGAKALAFVAPGPYAVVAKSGRFSLENVAPGHRTLHVWHPRFPPASRTLDLAPDSVARVDIQLGVERAFKEAQQ